MSSCRDPSELNPFCSVRIKGAKDFLFLFKLEFWELFLLELPCKRSRALSKLAVIPNKIPNFHPQIACSPWLQVEMVIRGEDW